MLSALSLESNERSLLSLIQSNPIPSYRQAYSDRTAWLMACFSELVYQPFEGLDVETTRRLLEEKLQEFLDQRTKETLDQLVQTTLHDNLASANSILNELEEYEISIQRTYDRDGTQALLISTKNYLALVFRGTEKGCLKDIKADVKAIKTRCQTNGGIHSGFSAAFDKVGATIQNDLNQVEFQNLPLFLAGHSLGGALATVATKRLQHNGGIASCYTFGSPRVGDEEWSYGIKTPIYRIVNALDCVTMLPPGDLIVKSLKVPMRFIPFAGKFIERLLAKVEGYLHVGDMRYLTSCKQGQYHHVKLTYSVSFARRLQTLLKGQRASKFVIDHSISIYRKKLAVIANHRNPPA